MLALLPAFLGKVAPGEIFASLSMQSRAVEEAREAGGALLVGAWCALLSWSARARQIAG